MPKRTNMLPDIRREPDPHDPELFVGREKELGAVLSRIEENLISRGPIPPPSVVHLWGLKGVGKSWFLRQLQHESERVETGPRKKHRVISILVNFEDKAILRDGELSKRSLLGSILDQTMTQVDEPMPEPPTMQDAPDSLIEFLKGLTLDYTLLFLFDTAEVLPQADQLWLGSALIAPLVQTDQVMVVLAGRREIPRWRDLAVRQRLKVFELKPFDKETTEKQFQKRKYPSEFAETVYRLSFGHPYASQVIGDWLYRQDRLARKTADFEREHLSEVAGLLSAVEEELLRPAGAEPRKKEIKCLAALRRFNVESARKVLSLLSTTGGGKRSDGDYLRLFEELQGSGLVWWSSEKHGYVVGEPLRRIIDLRFEKADPKCFQERHRVALEFYSRAVERNPIDQPLYLIEILYHLARTQAGATEEDLQGTIDCEFVQRYLNTSHLTVDGADTFLHLLDRDEELQNSRNILPSEMRDMIHERISAFVIEKDAQVVGGVEQ